MILAEAKTCVHISLIWDTEQRELNKIGILNPCNKYKLVPVYMTNE